MIELVFLFCIIVIAFLVYNNVIIIPPNKVAIVESMGHYSRTLTSGMHVLIPFIENIHRIRWTYVDQNNKLVTINSNILTARNAQLDIPPIDCLTQDSMPLTIDVTIFYNIENLNNAVYNCTDPLNLFYQCIVETIRDQISRTSSENVTGKDKALSILLVNKINEAMGELNGIVCKLVRIQSVHIPKDINKKNRELATYTREHNVMMQKLHYDRIRQLEEAKNKKEVVENELRLDTLRTDQLMRTRLKFITDLKTAGFSPSEIVQYTQVLQLNGHQNVKFYLPPKQIL